MSKQKVIVSYEDQHGNTKEITKQGELVTLPELNGSGVIAKMLIDGDDTPVSVSKLGREKVWRA